MIDELVKLEARRSGSTIQYRSGHGQEHRSGAALLRHQASAEKRITARKRTQETTERQILKGIYWIDRLAERVNVAADAATTGFIALACVQLLLCMHAKDQYYTSYYVRTICSLT